MGKKSRTPETEGWVDESKRRHRELTKTRSDRFKPEEGETSVRILPRLNEDGVFKGPPYYEYYAIGNVGPERRFLTSGKNLKGKGFCWLTDEILPKLRDSDSKADRDRAKEMEPKLQFVVQVAYLDDKGEWVGPAIWSVPTGGRGALATRLMGKINGRPKSLDLKKGYNLRIYRTGKGKNDTRYETPEFDDAPSRVPKDIVAKIRKFSDLVRPYDEDYMRDSYYGRDSRDRDGDRDSKRGKRDKGGKAKKSKGGKGGKSYTSKEFRDLYGGEE